MSPLPPLCSIYDHRVGCAAVTSYDGMMGDSCHVASPGSDPKKLCDVLMSLTCGEGGAQHHGRCSCCAFAVIGRLCVHTRPIALVTVNVECMLVHDVLQEER